MYENTKVKYNYSHWMFCYTIVINFKQFSLSIEIGRSEDTFGKVMENDSEAKL